MTTATEMREGLAVDSAFCGFIEDEVLPQTSIDKDKFWAGVQAVVENFIPRNNELLAKRELMQSQIDGWHQEHNYEEVGMEAYMQFLRDIGYLVEEGDDFTIDTENVDDEIATMAGPQLVVPVKNARFALNAANARWGSLYDSLYGTDAIPQEGELKAGKEYNQERANAVIKYGRDFLDRNFPLNEGASHHDVTLYQIYYQQMTAVLEDGSYVGLKDSKQFVAFNGSKHHPEEILLKNNGLLINIRIQPNSMTGKSDKAGVEDIRMEAALTTIMDCEDSVAAVDSEDKIEVYRNWMGLMTGNLSTNFVKGGRTVTRALERDRVFTGRDGDAFYVRRRSLMFVRNVGHLMTIDTIKDGQGNPIPEGILDGIFTSLISTIDLNNSDKRTANSRTNSIYIVKPKMHGPEEVAFTCDLFSAIEELLDLPKNTLKVGIMDEERRTTVNLKECIRQARERCVFINTGFLDRTGDEIHTSMEAGAFLPKDKIKEQPWISAYEDWNVDIGLACGLSGKAQIGKGMWPKPDAMADMIAAKKGHPLAGANTAWVPSPTAAILHALHYHEVDVFSEQDRIRQRERANVEDILTLPLLKDQLSEEEVMRELENNIQGLLGYVVRWVEHGVGCSKVPDINHVGLMEDRATLRISSQHIANWLRHDVCTGDQVMQVMENMAKVVDEQNAGDPMYVPMTQDLANSKAFHAAKDLIFAGLQQPSGYTEPLLHRYRLEVKSA